MARNVPLTDDDKALIATEYAELRAEGMSARDAEDVLAAKFGINSRTVRGYRGTEPLTSADFEARESNEYVKGTSTLYDDKGNVKLRWVKADKARDAWAASMGYQSGRDMKAIILHRQFGEVARHIVSVDMLRNITAL